ncbi:MAG: protein-L-isoaspartate(D-aspartate) O-methyltransferase [Methylacidiphilales bacterium]|nr:protein-L-isoaspartate(D-aspartate) O-methyltransferase [Candidatus Methylacidiphilales bacterium]
MIQSRKSLISHLSNHGISNAKVLEALGRIPRHQFVEESLQARAYHDVALPIGHAQTISQPWVVARMAELLFLHSQSAYPDLIFEVGTGSGYQTALLAQLTKRVVTIERIFALHSQAQHLLTSLGVENIECRYASSHLASDHAQYDAVILSAASDEIPVDLFSVLKPQGVMIIPLGNTKQQLTVLKKNKNGVETYTYEQVVFVPYLKGEI